MAKFKFSRDRLSNLAWDVIINIAYFLRPCDIVSLRQTCKSLLVVSKLRTVWINALRGVLTQRCIPETTYPLKMPLTMLEHLALSPHRFISMVKKNNGGTISPMAIRVLTVRLTAAEKNHFEIRDMGRIHDIFLAPGGRYLFTLSTSPHSFPKATLITVWDIGVSPMDVVKPLTRCLESRADLELHSLFPDKRLSGVFYSVMLQRSISSVRIIVHQASLGCHPNIVHLEALELPAATPDASCLVYHVPGSHRIVISSEHNGRYNFRVWDFLHNTGACLVGPDPSIIEKVHLFVYEDCVMAAFKDKIAVYNMPELSPLVAGQPMVEYDEVLVVQIPSDPSDPSHLSDGYWINCSNIGSINRDIPPHILRIDSENIAVIEITSIPSPNPTHPKKLPKLKSRMDMNDARLHAAARGTLIDGCEEHLCFGGAGHAGVSVSVLNVAFPRGKKGVVDPGFVSAKLEPSVGIEVNVHGFCPMLGRDCVLTTSGDVFVFDYLLPNELD